MFIERAIDIEFTPTSTPGVWLGVLRLREGGSEVVVSDYYRLGPTRPGFDPARDRGEITPELRSAVAVAMTQANDQVNGRAPFVPCAYPGTDAFAPVGPREYEVGFLGKIVSAAKDVVGTVGKPAFYAASVFTGGVPGLVVALATDKTGVLDAVADLTVKAGGIFMDLVGSIWFQALCSSVSVLVGVPAMGYGCIVASLGMELTNILAFKKMERMPAFVNRCVNVLTQFANVGIDEIFDTMLSMLVSNMKDAGLDLDQIVNDGLKPFSDGLKRSPFINASAVDAKMGDIMKKYSTGAMSEKLKEETKKKASNALMSNIKVPRSEVKTTQSKPWMKNVVPPGSDVQILDMRNIPTRSAFAKSPQSSFMPPSKTGASSRLGTLKMAPIGLRRVAPYVLGALGVGVIIHYATKG